MDFRSETQEKIKALLKNAEISQSEERLKQELRNESHEASELFETTQSLQETLRLNEANVEQLNNRIEELDEQLRQQHVHIDRMDDLKREIHEKNKVRQLSPHSNFEQNFILVHLHFHRPSKY